ncbi:protein kinase domain-containing protein [Streptosporangium soli]|nr:protein kinase [Streptosporangium sp. KLBMP 9127]
MPLAPSTGTRDPDALGGYHVSRRLGAGRQGVIYAAEAPDGSAVAVKLLHPRFRLADEGPERFLAALDALRGAEHPRIANVLDAGAHDGRPYVVSTFADGFPLSTNLSGRRLASLVRGTARALASLHADGVIHRDLKPGNIVLGVDGPWLLDAGIAGALEASATVFSATIGTPEYMSPEQIAGDRVDAATDVFSWAATMAFAATGRVPFSAGSSGRDPFDDSVPAVLSRVYADMPDLSDVPAGLRRLLERCLAKSPEDRPGFPEILSLLPSRRPRKKVDPAVAEARRASLVVLADDPPAGPRPDDASSSSSPDSPRGEARSVPPVAAASAEVGSLEDGGAVRGSEAAGQESAVASEGSKSAGDSAGEGSASSQDSAIPVDSTPSHDPADDEVTSHDAAPSDTPVPSGGAVSLDVSVPSSGAVASGGAVASDGPVPSDGSAPLDASVSSSDAVSLDVSVSSSGAVPSDGSVPLDAPVSPSDVVRSGVPVPPGDAVSSDVSGSSDASVSPRDAVRSGAESLGDAVSLGRSSSDGPVLPGPSDVPVPAADRAIDDDQEIDGVAASQDGSPSATDPAVTAAASVDRDSTDRGSVGRDSVGTASKEAALTDGGPADARTTVGAAGTLTTAEAAAAGMRARTGGTVTAGPVTAGPGDTPVTVGSGDADRTIRAEETQADGRPKDADATAGPGKADATAGPEKADATAGPGGTAAARAGDARATARSGEARATARTSADAAPVARAPRTAGGSAGRAKVRAAGSGLIAAGAQGGRTATPEVRGPAEEEESLVGGTIRPVGTVRRGKAGRRVLVGIGLAAAVAAPAWLVFGGADGDGARPVATVGIVTQAGVDEGTTTGGPEAGPRVTHGTGNADPGTEKDRAASGENGVATSETKAPVAGENGWLGYGYRVRSVGAGAEVRALAVAKVGKRHIVVSGDRGGRVRLWDLATGKAVGRPFKGHKGAVEAVGTTTLGKKKVAVTGGRDGTVRIWDLKTRKAIGKPYKARGGAVSALAVVGRNRVAVATANEKISFVDLKRRRAVGRSLRGHKAAITWLAAGKRDGKTYLASGSRDETARIWDPVRRRAIGKPYRAHTRPVETLVTGILGGRLVVASAGQEKAIRVWDAGTRKAARKPIGGPKGTIHALGVIEVAGRETLVAGGSDGMLRAWDLETGKLRGKIDDAHPGSATVLLPHVDADGRLMLISAGPEKTLRIWRFGALT